MDLNTVFDFQAATFSREHFDARFTYFTSDEIRNVAVQEITTGGTADRGGEALPEGLHAPGLGPMESELNRNPICPTCGLDRDCPGHMGRVELCMSCYNPFLFQHLHKLLNFICMDCYCVRCSPQAKRRCIDELTLLATGKIPSVGLKQSSVRGTKSAIETDINRDAEQFDELLEDHVAETRTKRSVEAVSVGAQAQVGATLAAKFFEAAQAKSAEDAAAAAKAMAAEKGGVTPAKLFKEGASLDAWRDVTKAFMTAMPKTCQNCASKHAGKWRKDGFAKLFVTTQSGTESFALPDKVREILRKSWNKEAEILGWLMPGMREHGAEMFFVDNLLVPPNRFRPPAMVGAGQMTLSKQTTLLKDVLEFNQELRAKIIETENTEDPEAHKLMRSEMVDTFVMLQNAVNGFMDSAKGGKHPKTALDGIRQLLEKKEGLFRMKMMGKRVNFAARSVISPDPNVETSEIGIPQMIAQELAYPETAGPHNCERLRHLVLRGAQYPGATEVHVPQTDGSKIVKNLRKTKLEQREALAKQLITDVESGRPPMTVFRQLQTGDPLLVNRQPTLHKPGIMAHTAKVLRFEKTIRMHYANCNTYNADFDGDEMNLHAPQDPISRIEALEIARADKQYLVPTSGKPLRGLIQDHVIAGVMLSKRDTHFSKSDACLLVYAGLRAAVEGNTVPLMSDNQKSMFRDRPWLEPKVCARPQKVRVKLDPPCIWKPVPMWSGKQVFSMVLKNIIDICDDAKKEPAGRKKAGTAGAGLSFESKSKTPGDIWNAKFDGNKEESSVFFQDSELLRGVLDKSQFGASDFGLVHAVFEMVGSRAVGMLLSSIARLFSTYLQMRGFTCAFADLVLHSQADERRAHLIKASRATAKATSEEWLGKHKGAVKEGASVHQLSEAAKNVWEKDRIACQDLEGMMLSKMRNSWGEVVNAVFPHGTKLPFPRNCFAAMVQTGAKGSKVNQSQVTCCLGQQELEGRAPPLMVTRRALPCFAPYDMASRTRGYITDRFLTGIRPQEFFFHCMAGREGLVDTAVKTSRSGYLQRCLVKHLESLKVCYDLSVRDADGSVVQFMYGEDGLDVTQASHLYKFDSLHSNFKMLRALGKDGLDKLRTLSSTVVEQEAYKTYNVAMEAAKAGEWQEAAKALKPLLASEEIDEGAKQQIRDMQRKMKMWKRMGVQKVKGAMDPMSSVLAPSHFFGSTSEAHEAALQVHLAKQKGLKGEDAALFADYMRLKFMKSLAHPGEAVGVIAAQSMGEPSTQMTLNTFHLAGHGGANVTLGIPRLREIIQTGGSSNSTPSMRMQVVGNPLSKLGLTEQAQILTKKFRHVTLLECLRSIVVHDQTRLNARGNKLVRRYHVRLEFWPLDELCVHVPHLSPARLEAFVKKEFMRRFRIELKRYTNAVAKASVSKSKGFEEEGQAMANSKGADGEEGEGGKDDDEAEKPKEAKRRKRVTDDDDGADEDEAEKDDGSEDSGMYSDDGEKDLQPTNAVDGDEDDIIPDVAAKAKKKTGAKGAAEEPLDTDDEEDLFGFEDETGEPSSKRRAVESDTAMGKPRPVDATSEEVGASDLAQAAAEEQTIWMGGMREDTITFVLTLTNQDCGQRLLVTEMVNEVCKRCELQDENAMGIKKVTVRGEKGKVYLECEGVNLLAFNLMPEQVVDHARMYTNDIKSILNVYGVEAARRAVVNEVKSVFGHYGIEVNHRHLSLIADYMAMGGRLRAFSRAGIDHSASPLQQMSYETTMQFLTKACNVANSDLIVSPASALVVGAVPTVGTGMVSLLMDLDEPKQQARKRVFNFT